MRYICPSADKLCMTRQCPHYGEHNENYGCNKNGCGKVKNGKAGKCTPLPKTMDLDDLLNIIVNELKV